MFDFLIYFSIFAEHANALVKVYDENFDKLLDKLRSSVMRCKSLFTYSTNLIFC
jgi:hypothetical protein